MLSGKQPPHSPFHPNNNTPTTDCDLCTCSQNIKYLRLSRSDYNNNSQFTNYPSTRCSYEPHLTTSSLPQNAAPLSSLSRADSEALSLPTTTNVWQLISMWNNLATCNLRHIIKTTHQCWRMSAAATLPVTRQDPYFRWLITTITQVQVFHFQDVNELSAIRGNSLEPGSIIHRVVTSLA